MPDDQIDGTGGAGEISADNPAVQALIEQATKGLRESQRQILSEKKSLQQQFEEFKQQFDGIDPEATRQLNQRIAADEDTRLIAEGKVDEVLERRTKALKGDFQKQLDAAAQREADFQSQLQSSSARIKELLIEQKLSDAAAKLGMVSSAVVDARLRAANVFALNEEGDIVAKDSDGSVVLGKDGKTPLTPAEWLETQRETSPHWFPAPSGGGASGGAGSGAGGGGVYRISKAEAADARTYQAAKKAAEARGHRLVITD